MRKGNVIYSEFDKHEQNIQEENILLYLSKAKPSNNLDGSAVIP